MTVIALMVSMFVGVFAAQTASASHYRANQMTWQKGAGPTETQIHLNGSWRCTFFFAPCSPSVGDTFSAGTLDFGDGSSTNPTFAVLSFDAVNDVVTGEAVIDHIYPSTGPYTAAVSDCCRLSGSNGHINNPDGSIRYETIVDLSKTVASPESLVAPVVDCPVAALCTFTVPAVDPDGQALRWRLATDQEASGSVSGFVQPSGASINPASGLYSWNTTGAVLAASGPTYYSTQVIVENLVSGVVISKTAVDFFIRLGSNSTNNQPVFTSPTPADGSTINGTVGSPLTFSVAATDPDAADTVTLGLLGLPSGASFNATPGNPASGSFSWTPSAPGDYPITLTAADQQGLGAVPRGFLLHVTAATSTGKTASAQGTVKPASGGNPTSFNLTATDSNGSTAGGTLTGSAKVTAPGTKGTFIATSVTKVVFNATGAVVTYGGTWKGVPGHTLLATLTDGSPDRIKLVVKQGATNKFTVLNALLTGFVTIS